MDCTGVAALLVAYHLGTVSEEEADTVEAHIVDCSACLKTYLALKRAADRAQLEQPRPEVKARLRAEVAREFSVPVRAKVRSFAAPVFARRIPLYQSVALAAVAASIALVAPSVLRHFERESAETASVPLVDTARTRAESLHIY
jgi:anti-sigma factor RsiW